MLSFPQPHYMPCVDCGVSIARHDADQHVCEPERALDFALFKLRGEVERLDEQLTTYLATPRGRFDAWYAEHSR